MFFAFHLFYGVTHMHTGGRTHYKKYLARQKLTINGARLRQWLAIE